MSKQGLVLLTGWQRESHYGIQPSRWQGAVPGPGVGVWLEQNLPPGPRSPGGLQGGREGRWLGVIWCVPVGAGQAVPTPAPSAVLPGSSPGTRGPTSQGSERVRGPPE